MGIDTTPSSDGGNPERPEPAPRWFIVLLVLIVGVGGFWLLDSFLSFSRPAAGSLPDVVHICGRDYSKDETERHWTSAEMLAAGGGAAPVIVNPGPFGLTACPAGACTTVAAGPCNTVIFLRLDENAYVDYALEGGP